MVWNYLIFIDSLYVGAIDMEFINQTGLISDIVVSLSNNGTGSLFLSLLLIVLFLMGLAMVFRIPMELTSILILPMLLTLMAFIGQFWTIGGVMLIYLALIMTKYFFFYR